MDKTHSAISNHGACFKLMKSRLADACTLEAAATTGASSSCKSPQKSHAIDLTNLIYRQLRYGCNNPGCKKPACRSYQSNRKSDQPYRRPTKLAARHIAACIASSDSPMQYICTSLVNSTDEPRDVAFPTLELPSVDASKDLAPEPAVASATGSKTSESSQPIRIETYSSSEQIDEKSFSQMLFNTSAWKSAQSRDVCERGQLIKMLRECYDHRNSAFTNPDLDLKATAAVICMALRQIYEPFGFRVYDRESPVGDNWNLWVELRKNGEFTSTKVVPGQVLRADIIRQRDWTSLLLDDHHLRVARLAMAIFASRTLDRETSTIASLEGPIVHLLDETEIVAMMKALGLDPKEIVSFPRGVLEWCRYVLQLSWDNKAIIRWSSMAGAAICFMQMLYSHRESFGIQAEDFVTHFLFKRTDFIEVAKSWIANDVPSHSLHLLSLPWLFEQSSLVSYFRAMNHSTMGTAVNASLSLRAIINRHGVLARNHDTQIYNKLVGAVSQFLVLEVNRSTILEDAMSELWRRDRRQLRRPLKVRMGMEEGEEGVDLGGVQQEFLRLAFGEVMNPDYGAFKVDARTRMAWFMPCSRVPLYQYQLIGMLMGLAVYNGITLSVTFPEALYRKLLGQPIDTLEHISDGWPELSRGLGQLLEFSDGDVEDVFVRSYIFSTEATGGALEVAMRSHDADLEQWPADRTDPSDPPEALDDAPMVTNANRAAYVADYIRWLVHRSVAAEYEAFARGFFAIVEPRTVAIFRPPQLRALVEGLHHDVDVSALERTATYEGGYARSSPVVRRFWSAVRRFSPQELLKLLAFVTASDRVPARGIDAITFTIQRNGDSDERLPTSMTCFGRLLLPAYSSVDVMEQRLRQAIENGLGFGVA